MTIYMNGTNIKLIFIITIVNHNELPFVVLRKNIQYSIMSKN